MILTVWSPWVLAMVLASAEKAMLMVLTAREEEGLRPVVG